MRKILVAIMLVLVLSLSGCGTKENKTMQPQEWALQYAEEKCNYDYENSKIIAFKINDFTNYDLENDFDYLYIYEITFISNHGHSYIYNVAIGLEKKTFNFLGYYKEDKILDVDIFEADNG